MKQSVGFIGLGIMGRPMALNLLRAGVPLLVNDISAAAAQALTDAGAAAGTPAEIGRSCSLIFTILPSGVIVRDVLFGPGGVAGAMAAGGIVCDMSSVSPEDARFCRAELDKLGVGFVDAPVSGGEPKAIDGTLSFMAGGRPEHFHALREYFDMMGASAMLVGDTGAGCVTKLANQMIVNLTIAAVSEAFVLATKAGVDPEKVYAAIRGGLAGSTVLDAKLPMMVSRDFRPGGKISINHKDIHNVLETAHQLDVPVPLSGMLFEMMQSLKVHGHMDEDHAGIVQYFEALAGVQVKKTTAGER